MRPDVGGVGPGGEVDVRGRQQHEVTELLVLGVGRVHLRAAALHQRHELAAVVRVRQH